MKVIQGAFWEEWRQSSISSSCGPVDTWVMKTSALARASLKASLVDFDSLQELVKSDSGRDIGQLSQDVKAVRCCGSFRDVF